MHVQSAAFQDLRGNVDRSFGRREYSVCTYTRASDVKVICKGYVFAENLQTEES